MRQHKLSRKHIFYVYVLLDPRKPGPYWYGHWRFDHEPFYVGKGKHRRAYNHFKLKSNNNSHRARKIRKIFSLGLEPILVFKRTYLTEKQAFELEKKLIPKIGRSDLGEGPLTNHSDGGDGPSGMILSKKSIRKREATKRKWSPRYRAEVIAKITKASIGRKHPPRSNEWRRKQSLARKGVKRPPRSAEWCAKISEIHKGMKPSLQTRQKISRTLTGRAFPHTAEWDANISKALKGRKGKPHTEKWRKNMSRKMKGRIITLEWRKKISDANKIRWAKAKAIANE